MAKKKTKKSEPKVQVGLTMVQRRQLLLTPCQTIEELDAWIKYHIGMDLPDTVVSRYAQTSPLGTVWEIYKICVLNDNPDKIEELLYTAARGSGKCTAKGTIVTTDSGPKYIENVTTDDKVFTGYNWAPVKTVFDEGVMKSVTVKSGPISRYYPNKKIQKVGAFDITGSHERHRLLVLDRDTGFIDWKYMRDIKPKDLIYKSLEESYKNINTKSDDYEQGWTCGAITGDGCVNRHSKTNISLCSADIPQLRHYVRMVRKHWSGKIHRTRRNSKNSISVHYGGKDLRDWYEGLIEGGLCYFKKLKTLEHTPDFLAGFISGLMDTDGYKSGITLANPELIMQISQIFAIFGVGTVVNPRRRPDSTTKFEPGHIVKYRECKFVTALPEYLMPLFSKRKQFQDRSENTNEQYRYPAYMANMFGQYIRKKYEIKGGYWNFTKSKRGGFGRSNVKYSSALFKKPTLDNTFTYGYKIDAYIELAERLGETKWKEQLQLLRNGTLEEVSEVTVDKAYFYDIEVDDPKHSYWSNGFISHNTLALAIAEFMIILHDQRSTAHIGAILAQAKHCYNYQIQFMLNDKIGPVLNDRTITGYPIAEKMNMEKSTFALNDKYTGERVNVDFSIIPCTLKAVNGLHLSLVSVDEIDTIGPGEGVRAWRDIAGMIDSRGQRQALRVGISTRKSRYGLMAKQIDNAEKSGLTVRYWTTLEFSEKCPDKRSGTIETVAYANQDDGISITAERYNELPKTRRNEYIKNTFPGEKCLQCPLSSSCLGDAKKQTSKSKMLKPITDSIQKALSNGHEWATSQLFNLKPSVEGIIYKEFEERRNVVTWNEMWKRLTGMEYPGECTHDRFVSKCHQMKVPIYVGVDFGWSNPSTAVFVAIDSRENVYILSTKAQTYTSNPVWAQTIKTKWAPIYRPQLCFIDTANPGDLVTFKSEGLPVPSTTGKPPIMDGVQVVKKWLRSLASPSTKILMTKDTSDFIIQEFLMYHFKTDAAGEITDTPDSSSDHALDALRYIFHGLFGQSTFMMAAEEPELTDTMGNHFSMPSPQQYAIKHGLETEQSRNVGKSGTLSELMDNDDDDINGDGGFLFGF